MEARLASLLESTGQDDPDIRVPAERGLKELEIVPGFYACLLKLFTDTAGGLALRLRALLYLKNSLQDLLTRAANVETVKQEKELIKEKLLELVQRGTPQEVPHLLEVQLSEVVARIARQDWRSWAGLFPSLRAAVEREGTDAATLALVLRGLRVLRAVLVELDTLRLPDDRDRYVAACASMADFVHGRWAATTQQLVHMLQKGANGGAVDTTQLTSLANVALLWARCLRRILVSSLLLLAHNHNPDAFPRPAPASAFLRPAAPSAAVAESSVGPCIPEKDPIVPSLIHALSAMVPVLVASPPDDDANGGAVGALRRLGREVGRTLLDLTAKHTVAVRNFLPAAVGLFAAILKASRPKGSAHPPLEPLVVVALNFLDTVVSSPFQSAVELPKLLSRSAVLELFQLLASQFFPLSSEELLQWEEGEEELAQEAHIPKEEKARPAAEALFWALIKHKWAKSLIVPALASLLQQHVSTFPPSSPEPKEGSDLFRAMLMKDAVYTATGLASSELAEHFTSAAAPSGFSVAAWYRQVLAAELESTAGGKRVIRRRVAWLLGQWQDYLPDDLRPAVYAQLTRALQDPDLVVRMAVVRTFTEFVEGNSFQKTSEGFLSVLPSLLAGVFRLLGDVSELSLKHEVLGLVRTLIRELGARIAAAAPALCQHFPILWARSEDQNVLRIALLATLSALTEALGAQSVSIHSFLLPLIASCLEHTAPEREYLVRPALQLWLAALHAVPLSATAALESLGKLLPAWSHWVAEPGVGLDSADLLCQVLEAYTLLSSSFLSSSLSSISTGLHAMLKNAAAQPQRKIKPLQALYSTLDLFAQLFPTHFPDNILFPAFLEQFLSDLSALKRLQRPSPDASRSEKDAFFKAELPVSMGLPMLARLFCQRREVMLGWLSSVARDNVVGVMRILVDGWLTPSNVTRFQPVHRKAAVLAMMNALTSGDPELATRVPEIARACLALAVVAQPAFERLREQKAADTVPGRRVAASKQDRVILFPADTPVADIRSLVFQQLADYLGKQKQQGNPALEHVRQELAKDEDPALRALANS